MDTFFLGLKKLLVTTMFVVFAFVMIYVPQAPTSNVAEVNAGGGGGGRIVFDPTNTAQNLNTTIQSTINAAADTLNWTKENILDGIGWALAKRVISGMVSSLIDWVNSGFEGRPAFITDLGGFLRNIVDEELGRVISELGAVGSFICSPFRLDVQVSIATQYAQFDADGRNQSAPTCTLTGIIDNIQGFISGIDPGRGLADWLTITATPETYTPYGALLSAQATARARLINAEGTTLTELNWGSGFLSQSVCQAIEGTSSGQDCSIVTPGAIIQDALTLNLDSGRQVLVEADEINELIGALLAQLANKAITGISGLLGLSSGTGFTYTDYGAGSFLDALKAEADVVVASSTKDGSSLMTDSLRAERNSRSTNIHLLDKLAAFIVDPRNATGSREIATILNEEIFVEVQRSNNNIIALTQYVAEFDTASTSRQVEIFVEYSNLDITNEVRKAQNLADWQSQMSLLGIDPTDRRGLEEIIKSQNAATTTSTTSATTTP